MKRRQFLAVSSLALAMPGTVMAGGGQVEYSRAAFREAVSARRERLAAWMPWAKPVMGATLVVVGIAVLFHFDRAIEGWLLDQMPVWLQDLSVSV